MIGGLMVDSLFTVADVNYTGIGALLLGVAGLIGSLAAAYSTVTTDRRSKATLSTVKATAVQVGQIDNAVNGKPPGATTMVAQVQELHDDKFPPPNGDALLPLLRKVAADVAALKRSE